MHRQRWPAGSAATAATASGSGMAPTCIHPRTATALVARVHAPRNPLRHLQRHNGQQQQQQHPGGSSRASGAAAAAATTGTAAAAATAAACGACAAPPPAITATATAAAASSSWVDIFAVLLGYGCLVGSCFRSVPQIIAILRARSAEGLSLTSNLMELLCYTVTVAYNIQQGYAFNTYGEVFACWIQDVAIVGLIFWYMRLSGPVVAASTAAFGACCAWLFSSWCPMEVLSALQMSTIVVMAIGARLPQIWLNIRRGNAGVLSPATCWLNVAGCVVRIFTTAVLTRDAIIMGGCVTQLLLNAILLYQSIATPGRPASDKAADAAVAIHASDPPLGGAGEARGHTANLSVAAAAADVAQLKGAVAAAAADVAQLKGAVAAAAVTPEAASGRAAVEGGGGGGGNGGSSGGGGNGDSSPPPAVPIVTPAAA